MLPNSVSCSTPSGPKCSYSPQGNPDKVTGKNSKRKPRINPAAIARHADRHSLMLPGIVPPEIASSCSRDSSALTDLVGHFGLQFSEDPEPVNARTITSTEYRKLRKSSLSQPSNKPTNTSELQTQLQAQAVCKLDSAESPRGAELASTSGRTLDARLAVQTQLRSTAGNKPRRLIVVASNRTSRQSCRTSPQGTSSSRSRLRRVPVASKITQESSTGSGYPLESLFLKALQAKLKQNLENKGSSLKLASTAVQMFLNDCCTQLLTLEEEVRLAEIVAKGKNLKLKYTALEQTSMQHVPLRTLCQQLELKSMQEYLDAMHNAEAAKQLLVQYNRRLVVSVATKYIKSGVDLEDLIAEGVKGLWKAVESFDLTRGHKFSTFAHSLIRNELSRFVANHSRVVRLPVHWHTTINKIRRTQQELNSQLHRTQPATNEEIAQVLGMPASRVQQYLKAGQSARSLDSLAHTGNNHKSESGDTLLVDTIADECSAEAEVMSEAVNKLIKEDIEALLSSLNDAEKQVVKMRYGLCTKDGKGLKLKAVGEILHLSIESVRRIEQRAMKKLRRPFRKSLLRPHLYVTPAA